MRILIGVVVMSLLVANVSMSAASRAEDDLSPVQLQPSMPARLEVMYGKKPEQLITSMHYTAVDPLFFTGFFPSSRHHGKEKKVRFCIFQINRNISAEMAMDEMRQHGCWPATLEELLAFGKDFFASSSSFVMAALGTTGSVYGEHFSPALVYDPQGRRRLRIVSWENGFDVSMLLGIQKK
ncbi:MAG: hypothetical protein ACYC75_03860 [Minisyncoccota bacterium]